MVKVNEALKESLERIDVITHRDFVNFFCLQLHY